MVPLGTDGDRAAPDRRDYQGELVDLIALNIAFQAAPLFASVDGVVSVVDVVSFVTSVEVEVDVGGELLSL